VGIEPDIAVPWDFTSRGYLEDIGVPIELTDEGMVVVEPIPVGSPASEAGLQAGDIIVEVDGIDPRDATAEELVRLGQGPESTEAHLMVLRPGQEEPEALTITRTYPETLSQGDPQLEAAINFLLEQ
jgi:carboxyl-terminal processing protease